MKSLMCVVLCFGCAMLAVGCSESSDSAMMNKPAGGEQMSGDMKMSGDKQMAQPMMNDGMSGDMKGGMMKDGDMKNSEMAKDGAMMKDGK